jgi:adenylate cyclase
MTDTSRFVMIVKRHNIERVLGAHEHPAYLQKLWLEQAGYTDADNISDHGREDNSYLFQFVFREQSPQVTLPVADDLDTNPAKSRYFDFQARNLPSIPKAFFRYAPNIITLNLSRNHGFSLPVEFAQQCTELRELRLANNDYKYVPEAVRHLASLTHLDLSCNRIEELDHAQLDQVKPLNSLLLQNNRLTDLPPSFGQFVSLTALYLSNNRFDHVPRVICEIRSLVTLDLSFNNISTIPDEIGQLTKLQRLLLVSNRISGTLPKTFDRLVELRELDLRQNSIQDLGVLSSMSRLKMLFLDYNTVSTLTCEFRQLQQLTLHKNHLTSFKPSSVPTTSLVSLNLSKSKLAQLPDAMFEQLPMLETLILDDNKFVSVPASICSLKQLNYLSCANNLLTSLPAEIYQLEYLSRLDVHGNNLAWLPQEIWYCQRLSTLNCSSNLLKTFPDPPAPGQKPPPSLGSGTLGIGATLSNNVSSVSLSSSISNSSTLVNVRHNSSSTPPLATAMRHLLLGDNGLTDDVFSPLAHFIDLRTLNLSFNDIYDIPAGGLYNHSRLTHLYLSGNQITSLPAEEIGRLRNLRELFVNGNKLHSLPAELGKIVRLQVLDVGSNVLKYNICNWPFDWNWNWNRDLKYLNLSNNKRLEIKENRQDMTTHQRNLADFSTLQHLRVLGLMDLTLMATPPEELPDRRVRTTCSVVNNMAYGMADTLGRSDMLCAWDLVIPKFRGRPNECLFALFDGRMGSKSGGSRGCKITKELSDRFPRFFEQELQKLRENETIETAMKRAFLNVNRAIGASNVAEARTGATALVVYIVDKVLYAANVGDALAVLARQRCDALPLTMKHTPWLPEEIKRIQAAGGFVSHQGLVNDELEVSRSFGHFHLVPIINANPYISKTELTDDDEFVIMASKGFWNWMSYQTAVDVARTESEDMMLAAQKLRDFAISYGADESIMIMVIRVGDLFRAPSFKEMSLTSHHVGQQSLAMTAATGDIRSGVKKNRRIKENLPGDSTLRRLQEEVEAPKGQVALVFTDIKNSTFLWDTLPRAMQSAIKTHNEIMRRYLRNIGGYEVKTEGDAFMVCFPSVASALLWCLTVQLQLLQADWPQEILDAEDGKEIYWIGENGERELIYRGLSVRMGIHWGMPVCEEDPITRRMDYFGPMVNRSARISGVADGGQICVSQDVVNEVEEISKLIDTDEELELPQQNLRRQAIALHRLGFVFINIGERKLKGLETAETLSLTYPQALRHRWDYTQRQLQAKASIRTMPEPSALPILDPDTVRRLGFLCLRLERITSGTIIPPKRKSRIDHLNGLLTFHVKDNVDDEELLRITENLVTRIQVSYTASHYHTVHTHHSHHT